MRINLKTNLFIVFLIICTNSIVYSNRVIFNNDFTEFNYDEGGDDWKGICKTGNQAPIDIKAPFNFKSKLN